MDFFAFDDDYVRRLRDGDRATEEHFLAYFQELMLIKLRRRVRGADAIDDIRQEVFVRVFRALRSPDGGVRDGRRLGAFVNTVCNYVLLEQYRKDSRSEPLDETQAETVTTDDDALGDLVTRDERKRVRRVVDSLPARDGEILREIFIRDRPLDEVCAKFGVDRGYLRVLLHRAKAKFRDAWAAETDLTKSSLRR